MTARQLLCLSTVLIIICSSLNSEASYDQEAMSKSVAYYTLGTVYDLQGLTQEAVEAYEKAAAFDENSYMIHLRLGTNYVRLGKLPEAIEELSIVTELNPEDLQARYLLALLYSTQKDYEKAALSYESILKLLSEEDPQNIEIYGYLGQLYYTQKQMDKAISQFEKILELESKNADVMYLLGSLYLEVNNNERAVEVFVNSIEIDPEHDGSLNSLGYIYAEIGINLDLAVDYVQRAIAIEPNNGAYWDSLGWVYYKKEMYDEAMEALLKANKYLEDPIIYDHLGDVCIKIDKFSEAKKYWESALEFSSDQPSIIKKLRALEQQQVIK